MIWYFDGGGGIQKIHGVEQEEHAHFQENPCCGYKNLNEPTFLR